MSKENTPQQNLSLMTSSSNSNSKSSSIKIHPISKFGKLYRGPVVSAYNRKTLGSIPSTIENILFKNPHPYQESPKNFTSSNKNLTTNASGNVLKISFSSNNNLTKNQITQTSDELVKKKSNKNEIFLDSSNISLNSSQIIEEIYGKRKPLVPPSERFDYSEIENKKYLPGPCEYNNSANCIYENTNSNYNMRYKSLFGTGRENMYDNSINSSNDNTKVGPGSYNIRASLKRKFYISPYERFNNKMSDTEKFLGPGYYDANYDFCKKDKNKISYFFKNDYCEQGTRKKGIYYGIGKNCSIGPGFYDWEGFYKKQKGVVFDKGSKRIVDIKKEILAKEGINAFEDGIKDGNKGKNDKGNNDYFFCNLPKGNLINSKAPRFSCNMSYDNNKHVPGPCYYENPYKFIDNKKNYNANMKHNWI